jgi:hypothetical protein
VPVKDVVTADGDVMVPLDAEAFGFWLMAAFGDPVTTGTGPWTHEFRSGGARGYLPRPRIEISGPQGAQATFDWQAARDSTLGRMCTATLVNDIEEY